MLLWTSVGPTITIDVPLKAVLASIVHENVTSSCGNSVKVGFDVFPLDEVTFAVGNGRVALPQSNSHTLRSRAL